MPIIMRCFTVFVLWSFISACGNSETKNNNGQLKNPDHGNISLSDLKGCWKIVNVASADQYEMAENDRTSCLKGEICFADKKITVTNNPCLERRICQDPTYSIKKVNALDYFENDNEFLERINVFQDSVFVVETNCDVPFTVITYVHPDTIRIGMDNIS